MNKGKSQLLITWVVGPDKAAEMDRLAESHGAWMAKTDHGKGSTALLSYNLSKGPELASALDPNSASTGNTRYVLDEVYESPEGIANHWRLSAESWSDFAAMVEILSSANTQTLHGGAIIQSV